MNGKLAVKVSLDLEGASVTIVVRGSVNARNVQALHSLTHRANSLRAGLTITLDLSAATVEPAVFDALQAYASVRRLPRNIDPEQAECSLRILAGEPVQHARLEKPLTLAL